MKKRFKSKTQGARSGGARGTKARTASDLITDWKTRRVPVRKFSETVVTKKKLAGRNESTQAAAAPKRKSQMGEFQRILVPVDFSTHSAQALKYAAALAKRHESSVMLVHVVGPAHDLRHFGYAKQRLNTLAQKHLQRGLNWQPAVRSGNAPNQILQAAEEMEADVIVMSTRGLSHAPTPKIGSIAKRIVRNSPCPVLILPGRKDAKLKRATR